MDKETILLCGAEMRPIHGRARLNHMGDAHEANKPSAPGHTENGSVTTKYHKLMHRRCISLDLETVLYPDSESIQNV